MITLKQYCLKHLHTASQDVKKEKKSWDKNLKESNFNSSDRQKAMWPCAQTVHLLCPHEQERHQRQQEL